MALSKTRTRTRTKTNHWRNYRDELLVSNQHLQYRMLCSGCTHDAVDPRDWRLSGTDTLTATTTPTARATKAMAVFGFSLALSTEI